MGKTENIHLQFISSLIIQVIYFHSCYLSDCVFIYLGLSNIDMIINREMVSTMDKNILQVGLNFVYWKKALKQKIVFDLVSFNKKIRNEKKIESNINFFDEIGLTIQTFTKDFIAFVGVFVFLSSSVHPFLY